MHRSTAVMAVAVAGLLAMSGCAPAGVGPATGGTTEGPVIASTLLTRPEGSLDALTGVRIEPGVLGVARNGCVTVGGAYLQVGYGSALIDGGRSAALSGIGTFRIGQTVPAMYGYRRSWTAETLPKAFAPCGAGRYVSAVEGLASADRRASDLLVRVPRGGRVTTLNGRLDVGGNGCIRVGGQYLLAPPGSTLRDGGSTLAIPGSGSFTIGSWMPTLAATSVFFTAAQLPAALAACGPGGYVAISARQDQPALVLDAVDDSTRIVVQPESARIASTTTIAPATIGKRNTCVTIGDAILSAPHGSIVFDRGSRIRLTGIGTFRVGATSPVLRGHLRTYTDRSVPRSLIDCGGGEYVEVVPR